MARFPLGQDLKLEYSSRAMRGHRIKNFRRRFERKFGKAVGLKSLGLQKVSSSLQEVGNLPTRVYISSKCCLGLGWALRVVWIVFPNTKIVFY